MSKLLAGSSLRWSGIHRPPLTVTYEPPLGKQPTLPLTTSISSASGQLFPNTSLTSVPGFSYLIPYGQTQDCNIYGPICQIGSITVEVNLTTATTSTVLPCSSYLSAQSAYLFGYIYPVDWNTNFGQSPECRSYAKAMSQGQYTFSDCGSSNTVIQTARGVNTNYPSQLPPGVVQGFDIDYIYTCCGSCSLEIPEVRLYYFPDQTNTSCQNDQTSNITSTLSSSSLRKRVHSLVADRGTAIVSGHTL